MDYLKYHFYELTYPQRAGYVTRSGYEELCGRYDPAKERRNITDKCRFVRIYASCMEREILTADKQDAAAEYTRMCTVFPRLVYKPGKGDYCKGIRVFSTKDRKACEDVRRIFTEEGGMIEEYICQHEALAAFHPASVNTIRSVTVISRGGAPVLLAAAIRTGHGGRVTDNADGGGIFAEIDVETGIVTGNGMTHFDEKYVRHPDSGLAFAGTKIPEWEKFLAASKCAADIQPELRLCCWDWTLTQDGRWALIEGNVSGGLGLLQMAAGRGMREELVRKLGIAEK